MHAVYLAFSQHRPLVLTPDVIWLTLAQGFAHHVNNHAEALRSCLVAQKGKVTLNPITWERSSSQDWAAVIQQWSLGIQEHIPAEFGELMLCNFTTTTPTIRTASQVVMMDVFQQYFDCAVMCICGIPTITVRGSVEDWVAIRKRVDVMAGYHLEWWTDRLKPIYDGFIDTVQGHPSQWFWKHIYSPKEIYGRELILAMGRGRWLSRCCGLAAAAGRSGHWWRRTKRKPSRWSAGCSRMIPDSRGSTCLNPRCSCGNDSTPRASYASMA